MRLFRKARLRAFGGIAGAAVAFAGGIGAAVGIYTLPVPDRAAVDGDAYERAGQRAFAASTLYRDQYRSDTLRIEVYRGLHRSQTSWYAPDQVRVDSDNVAGVSFHAEIVTCWFEQGFCDVEQQWNSDLGFADFTFSPLMDEARFSGDAGPNDFCRFDIVWHPQGEIVPFEGHEFGSGSNFNPDRPGGNAGAGGSAHAEASRVAPADITMTPNSNQPEGCDPYTRQGAPGYITQGADSPMTGARAGFPYPGH